MNFPVGLIECNFHFHFQFQSSTTRTSTKSKPISARELADNTEIEVDTSQDSPLLKAERELQRLQQSMAVGDFVPKLQEKRYTIAKPTPEDMTVIDSLGKFVLTFSLSLSLFPLWG